MTLQLNISLPNNIYHRASQLARRRNQKIEVAIADFLTESLPTDDQLDDKADDPIEREIMAFQAMHGQLLKEFAGEYVAVFKGGLIDHDPDRLTLVKRLDQNFPDQLVLIRRVDVFPEREIFLRSPQYVESVA